MANSNNQSRGIRSSLGGKNNDSPGQVSQSITFNQAIVAEVISNPAFFDEAGWTLFLESLLDMENTDVVLKNASMINRAPRNSIIAVELSMDGHAQDDPIPRVYYPFFPPHLAMPISPGEKVWVTTMGSDNIGYWVCRVPGSNHADDLNHTHPEREKDPKTEEDKSIIEEFEGTVSESEGSFYEGGNKKNRTTLAGDHNYSSYASIEENAISAPLRTLEAVPRFTKRPGDLALQGSNNTLICLGEDRSGPVDNDPDTAGLGSIDIVCGRGSEGSDSEAEKLTNDKGKEEIVKNHLIQGTSENPNEGDPDFESDLSRIYLSMNTSGDENFGLEFTNASAPQVAETPYIIAKSTEIRLVGKDGGSVRMVKEGSEQCEISLMSDGTISIEGGAIYLGENAAGNTTQPVVQGALLKTAVDNFCTNLQAAVAESVGNLGVPVAMPTLASACSTFQAEVQAALSTTVYTK